MKKEKIYIDFCVNILTQEKYIKKINPLITNNNIEIVDKVLKTSMPPMLEFVKNPNFYIVGIIETSLLFITLMNIERLVSHFKENTIICILCRNKKEEQLFKTTDMQGTLIQDLKTLKHIKLLYSFDELVNYLNSLDFKEEKCSGNK